MTTIARPSASVVNPAERDGRDERSMLLLERALAIGALAAALLLSLAR